MAGYAVFDKNVPNKGLAFIYAHPADAARVAQDLDGVVKFVHGHTRTLPASDWAKAQSPQSRRVADEKPFKPVVLVDRQGAVLAGPYKTRNGVVKASAQWKERLGYLPMVRAYK